MWSLRWRRHEVCFRDRHLSLLIPRPPHDPIGHANGVVRLLNEANETQSKRACSWYYLWYYEGVG